MMRYDPVSLEDFAELLGPGGRMALMAGALACTALATPAIADAPRTPATVTAAAAQTQPPATAPSPEDGEIATSIAETPSAPAVRVRRSSPIALEMQKVIDEERQALVELRARFAAARGPGAIEIQREIERLKAGTEISLLRIQASWARRQGRLEIAREIEAAIEATLHPHAPAAAVAPARAGAR